MARWVIRYLQHAKLEVRLAQVRVLNRTFCDEDLRRLITPQISKVLVQIASDKISPDDRDRTYSLLFRVSDEVLLSQAPELSPALDQVLKGTYDWQLRERFLPADQQSDPMPLAAMEWQCRHHGGAIDLLTWLETQEWNEEGGAPAAIECLKTLPE